MWEKTLDRMLSRMMLAHRLNVQWPDGRKTSYGPGGGREATATLKTEKVVRDLCLKPVMALGEGYMDGSLTVADDELLDFLLLLIHNQNLGELPVWVRSLDRMRTWARGFLLRNNPLKSQRNVAHHYDISNELYGLFLDEDRQYSCAYFARPDMTLEQAQAAKKEHIARKLLIRPGMRVLDIGCGWGGMALTLARDHGARVTGVTLSTNQLELARQRARDAGLADRLDFRLLDYRKLDESFDRIVSVGMLEHVGLPQFGEYFRRVQQLLAPGGIALIHTIGRIAPPSATSPWIDKYIFPGGYVPSLSDLAPAVERSGLWTADIEVWRGHYGPTLHHWRERFEANLGTVRKMYDERFVRMWRFYLVACEAAFEEQYQAVFQLQLSKGQYDVPVTRDYLYDEGRGMVMHAAQ